MHDGALLIVDCPVLVYRDVGQVIQVIIKYMWQRAHAMRDVTTNGRPTFIVADEAQTLLVDADQHFQAIARSTRTAVLYATQSVSGLLEAFGQHSEAKVHAMLTNLQTRICHQQTDIRTVQYMQELIGKSRQYTLSANRSSGTEWLAPLWGEGSSSSGFAEVWEFELQASDLNALAKGGPPRMETEAIVFQGGRRFPSGRTWVRTAIQQQ